MSEDDGYLELRYKIEPDAHGVFDGRDLARALIANAYRLLMGTTCLQRMCSHYL